MVEQHPEVVEPDWCPFKGRCAHADCLIDLDRCASALMAAMPRSTVPDATPEAAPVRRVRQLPPLDPGAVT